MGWEPEVITAAEGAWPEAMVAVRNRTGERLRYVPERTCTMQRIENTRRILDGWMECSECGPIYPPASVGIQDAVRFCPFCGAIVEGVDE